MLGVSWSGSFGMASVSDWGNAGIGLALLVPGRDAMVSVSVDFLMLESSLWGLFLFVLGGVAVGGCFGDWVSTESSVCSSLSKSEREIVLPSVVADSVMVGSAPLACFWGLCESKNNNANHYSISYFNLLLTKACAYADITMLLLQQRVSFAR